MAHAEPSLLAASGRSDTKQRLTDRTFAPGQAKGSQELRLLSRMQRELTDLIRKQVRKNGDVLACNDLVTAAQAIKRRIRQIT